MSKQKKYTFILKNINKNNFSNIDSNAIQTDSTNNFTKIEELDKKSTLTISFFDETKKVKNCVVSFINFKNSEKNVKNNYNCYWDRHPIPDNIYPLGCPIKYIASTTTKTYHSEISKEKYSISESVTESKIESLINRNDPRITIDKKGFYQTDGVFCSFNCCMSFINENKHNPMYDNSEYLLFNMYKDLHPNEEIEEITNAPHWRILKPYGGKFTIEEFRDSFNKFNFTDEGYITMMSMGKIYENNFKLT
jgi:hypothetical protein